MSTLMTITEASKRYKVANTSIKHHIKTGRFTKHPDSLPSKWFLDQKESDRAWLEYKPKWKMPSGDTQPKKMDRPKGVKSKKPASPMMTVQLDAALGENVVRESTFTARQVAELLKVMASI